jgi:hypothetical protein
MHSLATNFRYKCTPLGHLTRHLTIPPGRANEGRPKYGSACSLVAIVGRALPRDVLIELRLRPTHKMWPQQGDGDRNPKCKMAGQHLTTPKHASLRLAAMESGPGREERLLKAGVSTTNLRVLLKQTHYD